MHTIRTTISFFLILFITSPLFGFEIGDINLHGFAEAAFGYRFKEDTTKNDEYNLFEQRLQIKTSYYPKIALLENWNSEFNFKGDFTIDEYYSGKTNYGIRSLNWLFSPFSWMDVKLGRQVFTWGTGDYLFINDVFPKDYISFFTGRNDEYLKKPSDGVKVSLFHEIGNLNIVAIPFFEPNTIPKGDRLSFFDPLQQGIIGIQSDRFLIEPGRQFSNTEIALRGYRNFSSYEAALYFFRGYYKMPRGYKNEYLGHLYYPRLNVYGASIRGPLLSGIANSEIGYYDSIEDEKGNRRTVENSQVKFLIGYEKDLGNDIQIGFQYYYEQTLGYKNLTQALLPGDYQWDEYRHLFTSRITKLLENQTIKLTLFTFYSPTDEDLYFRPSIDYNITDKWNWNIGANLIWGRNDHTEFGNMERNSNLYTRIRYNF